MLRFDVYHNGVPAREIDLAGAYLFGEDVIPVRADLTAADGRISCTKRIPGPCGLALLWSAEKSGRLLLRTTRLPERSKPYILNVELARAQMTCIAQKREDWGLIDYADADALNRAIDVARRKFVSSLKATDPVEASRLADDAIAEAVTLGEKIALFHADIFLTRRRASAAAAAKTAFGCAVDLLSMTEAYQQRLREAFDFVSIPIPWKHTEPKEQQNHCRRSMPLSSSTKDSRERSPYH